MSLVPGVFGGANGGAQNPTAAADVVGVFDQDGNQLFPLARPSKANINLAAKIAEHPLESGGSIVDHRVLLPIEIELLVYVTDYAQTYAKIRAAFTGKDLLVVHTRAGIYENMLIESMPHEETPESFDVVQMSIKLKEIRLIEVEFQALPPRQVKTPNDASTVDKGQQSTGKSGSVAYDWISTNEQTRRDCLDQPGAGAAVRAAKAACANSGRRDV
ncbi:MAG: hypothetical protein LBJ59_02680 [Zoogloeaceae bacterium]|jgi:hypothetical protein|nr:hypothetical protein [Zoogloeaceae bacterium]